MDEQAQVKQRSCIRPGLSIVPAVRTGAERRGWPAEVPRPINASSAAGQHVGERSRYTLVSRKPPLTQCT